MTEDSTPPYIWVSEAGTTIISTPDSHDGTPLIRYVHGAIVDEMLAELKDIAETADAMLAALHAVDQRLTDSGSMGGEGATHHLIVRTAIALATTQANRRGQHEVRDLQASFEAPMEWCIEQCRLEPGDVILDPYMGSGTTAIAAFKRKMQFVGCEIERRWFDVAVDRINRQTGDGPLFEAKPEPELQVALI